MSGTTLSVVLAERPTRNIIPGQTFKQKLLSSQKEDDLKAGEILVKTLYLGLEPAMRAWLMDVDTYFPAVKIGEVMRGFVLARVVASKNTEIEVGDSVLSDQVGWREEAILTEGQFEKAPELGPGSEITDLLGVYHWTGLTAYFGLKKIGQPKPGETVVISGAAGATGSVAGQIAKIAGARVVGIVGSDEKCEWIKELGFDVALNYKDPDFKSQFEEATPDLIDVFFDNVGGEILDLALSRANLFSRFVMSGAISQYNSASPTGPKNLVWASVKRIRLQGFIVVDYEDEFDDARRQIAQWIADGKIRTRATVIDGGLKVAEEALRGLFSGTNTGKLLVRF
ncbi:putative NADP-dependent oxidoreductase YfmJ [Fusarium keratoplasticum]|uniref:NADP-dependent oxidoreductase YfmJ n=1 Tax=Fusarium keratoplasticum TaxID=1328300 RepID=A0ACC0QIJ0_9HYPO|nr:putative NADP-dependent oxidoreductase YfmJ [Fusarium keratoplasticum]KAI8652789.1 putative NADP-dependent oxidoreductase YfmJ [Fusarium keratoplasticum]